MARNIWMWKYTGMSSGGPTEGTKDRLMKDHKGDSSNCFRQFNMLFFKVAIQWISNNSKKI